MTEKKEKIGIQKHIRITDSDITGKISRVMELPEYKSFNKVVNDALFYGLPVLCEKLFGEVTLSAEEPASLLPTMRQNCSKLDDEILSVIVRLLKETVLNVTINKSILSSLFHGKCLEYKGCEVEATRFENGLISDIPDYLYDYEMSGLKKMRR